MTAKKRDPLYYDKHGYTVQSGELRGAMTAPCMNNALKDSTNNRVSLRLWGCGRLKAYNHIRQGHFATRLFISWGGENTAWHWTTLYGSYRIKRFLWTNYYYLQADNGAVICPKNRNKRNPANAGSYEILQWFDTLFEVYN